jgi:hypothetical protein
VDDGIFTGMPAAPSRFVLPRGLSAAYKPFAGKSAEITMTQRCEKKARLKDNKNY